MSGLLPDRLPIEFEDIIAAMAGQVRLAMTVEGLTAAHYCAYLGVDPEGLERAAREAADDEFQHQHGMGPLATARLRNLSASQRTAVHQALVDTAEVFFRTGMTLAYIRAGVLGVNADAPGPEAGS